MAGNDSDEQNEYADRVPRILLAHGGGGKKMNRLLDEVFLPAFDNDVLASRHDGAVFPLCDDGRRGALTTDSYVVTPLFFPGGNLGDLAVHGTVNDLAVCGAEPQFLSAGFLLEEGFPTHKLEEIVQTMKTRAEDTGVKVVTGDTKVVDREEGEPEMMINTTGFGVLDHDQELKPSCIRPGDRILINGDIGAHGMTILAEREGIEMDTPIESDTMPVHRLIQDLIRNGIDIHCARDLTRGGLATAAIELAEASGTGITLRESVLPVTDPVKSACEMLGMDPEHVACEGRCMVIVPEPQAQDVLALMEDHDQAPEPVELGEVVAEHEGSVVMEGPIGGSRFLNMPGGEQLPRIC